MVGRLALTVCAAILASGGCGRILPGDEVLSVVRTDGDLRVRVAGWARSGAEVFLCPNPIVIRDDRQNVGALVLAAGCIIVGQVGADSDNSEVAVRFDELLPLEQSQLDRRATWSVVVLQVPEPTNHPPESIQQEIPGGPISPPPA